MDFKELFCLKERESFTIDPKINPDDARFYFGRPEIEEQLASLLTRSFIDPGVPKIVLYGTYGSGKTQTLQHLAYMLKTSPPKSLKFKPRMVDVILEMNSKSTALDWHLQLMEGIGKDVVSGWVKSVFSREKDFDGFLKKTLGDSNLVQAISNLRGSGDIPFIAWRWLCAQKLSPADLQRLQVTRNLGDSGSTDLVSVLAGIGQMAEANGEKLIFLMDEAESFQHIRNPDSLESVHNYMRHLAEPGNSTVGFIISSLSLTIDQLGDVLFRLDVRGRLGTRNYQEISSLESMDNVRLFIQQLLAELIDRNQAEQRIQDKGLMTSLDTYPFSAQAFDLFCDYASQEPTRALPRSIIKALNECAISAWDADKAVIEEDLVHEVVPVVFQQ